MKTAPSNEYGKEFVDRLADFPVEVVEVLKSTQKARASADVIASVLDWLSMPLNKKNCRALFRILYNEREKGEFYLTAADQEKAEAILEQIEHPEDFFYPLSNDALTGLPGIWETDELLIPLLTVVPLQLLAYYAAITRGCDVDKPRNLAKSVTVE